jgi:alpha-beta hydrolase superfamily lysophospholipase
MTPFYFGSPERRLFGLFDPARNPAGKVRAAVFCHPSGAEHVHAYRTMRQLASRLSAIGVHVLRFDYYGTGDSAGETGDSSIAGCCNDIRTAIAELKDMTHAVDVTLVGLRCGANMAARVAVEHPNEIADVVLWDPVTTAQEFFVENQSGDDFHQFDPSLLADDLPPRTLVVLTGPSSRSEKLGSLSVARFAGVSPWIEERTATGTIPLEALQGIVKWLT